MKRVAAVAIVVGSGCLASCFLKPDRPGGAPADGHGADAPTSACMGSVVWGMPHQLTELAGVGSSQESAWLSKDKSEADYQGIAAGLAARGDASALSVASWMKKARGA